ncbi:hypothetical protein J4430_01810 [Candidatus Woesearchaeota archaeon]|nr:hypothetical protein [Candidatus Woesearchaeota archaeon]
MIELGGNIRLAGFKDLEPAKLVVVKKVVGNYAKKLEGRTGGFSELSLHLKEVHKTEKSSKFEVQGKLIVEGKQPMAAEVVDYNLFFAIDKVLARILNELS